MTIENIHVDDSVIDKISALIRTAAPIHSHEQTHHVIVPADYTHKDITEAVEKAQPNPNRKRGSVVLNDIESFNRYVTDHGVGGSTYIYADPDARTLTAVFNDHCVNTSTHTYADPDARNEGVLLASCQRIPADQAAGWRDHRAAYQAELSREFATWLANNKQVKEQDDFAVFLEDNIADVVEPTGDVMLTVALTLQAKTEVNFSSSKRLDNGQVQISYTENIDARAGNGAIDIPREFAIGCRLFKNGEGYKVKARLKYRLGHGKVKFWYELDRPENVIEDAFTAYVAKASETKFTVLIGKA